MRISFTRVFGQYEIQRLARRLGLQGHDKAVLIYPHPVNHQERIELRWPSRLNVAHQQSLMRLTLEHHHRRGGIKFGLNCQHAKFSFSFRGAEFAAFDLGLLLL